MDEERYLTVGQASERLQVHQETVRRWLRDGRLLGRLISRRAGYRIPSSEVERLLAEGMPEEKLPAWAA